MKEKNIRIDEPRKCGDEKMFFYTDFESWVVEASTQEEAEKKALAKLKTGYIPCICNIDEVGESDRNEEDWGEGWYIAEG